MKGYVYICDRRFRETNMLQKGNRNRLEELSFSLANNNFVIKGVTFNLHSLLLLLRRDKSARKYSIVFDERFLILGILLKLKGVTLVFCPRGNKLEHFKHYYGRSRLRIYRFIFSLLYRFCDKMIFQTEAQQKEFEDVYNYNVKSKVVPNNVNPSWMLDINTLENFPGKPALNRIGFLGGDNPRKGATLLIDAFMKLKVNNPNIRMLVGGNYKDAPDLANVDFIGHVSNLKEFFHSIDLLVIPSIYDSFPNTLLESLAANKPFLISETAITREIVENRERLFFKLDAKELADKINSLYQNNEIWEEIVNDCIKLKNRYTFNWGHAMINAMES